MGVSLLHDGCEVAKGIPISIEIKKYARNLTDPSGTQITAAVVAAVRMSSRVDAGWSCPM